MLAHDTPVVRSVPQTRKNRNFLLASCNPTIFLHNYRALVAAGGSKLTKLTSGRDVTGRVPVGVSAGPTVKTFELPLHWAMFAEMTLHAAGNTGIVLKPAAVSNGQNIGLLWVIVTSPTQGAPTGRSISQTIGLCIITLRGRSGAFVPNSWRWRNIILPFLHISS